MSEGKCKDCHDLVIWVEMVGGALNGQNRSLHPVPKLGGNVERRKGKNSNKYYGRFVDADQSVRRYVLHRTVCEGAGEI